jgi:hypothetical protein
LNLSATEEKPMRRKQRSQTNRTRRHFLGLAAAMAARVGAMGALAATILPSSSAEAAWWSKILPGHGRGSGKGPMCLLRGTRVATPTGEVPIEDLRIGDLVDTVRGQAMAIKWIGRHRYRRSGATWNESVVPIRIARAAFDERTPHRDLYTSPRHGLLIDGIFIRASCLVNGASIAPALPVDLDTLEYFQIMLDTHEAVLAEGAPVETFLLENQSYEGYTNFAEFARLYPADVHATMTPFAPYYGGKEHLKALVRLATGGLILTRTPIQEAYERIASRGEELVG